MALSGPPKRQKFVSTGQRGHVHEQDVLDVIELEHQRVQRLKYEGAPCNMGRGRPLLLHLVEHC